MGRPLPDVMRMALEGGAQAVQLREKGLSDLDLYHLAEKTKRLCDEFRAAFLVNDRIDVVLGVGATGVHLGRNSFPVMEARRLLGSKGLIGASTHSVAEAKRAEGEGADFIVFGPVYYTPSKARYGDPLGEHQLGEVVGSVEIPVLAIGGVKASSVPGVLASGARGVAVISAILSADDPKAATREMLSSLLRN
jgi:thiamine-phosphate pyrophosphorylase